MIDVSEVCPKWVQLGNGVMNPDKHGELFLETYAESEWCPLLIFDTYYGKVCAPA